ncbi:MAG TPA: DUF402 domain-containing protein [Dehalococcoidia bacterium]
MSEKRWRRGEVILMEEFLARSKAPRLINVRPQVVVEDEPECLAIVSMPGMTWMTRDVPGRTAMTVDDRIELYMKEELNHDWYERTGHGAVLTLHPQEAAHCIRLFWDAEWRLRFWYVNLEDPYVRTDRGIQVNDHTLDVVVTPGLDWAWKDEPEFEALTSAGKIPVEKARAIRAEGERVIRRVEAREWPFNEPWPDWRPDASWAAPQIRDHWSPP